MKSRIEKKNNRNGFTLVEMLIAMFIFSMVAMMVLGAYFDVFQSKRKTRAIQQDIEDARYAMELMAKTIRMSSVFTVSNGEQTSIQIYDYSQKKCLKYELDDKILVVSEGLGVTDTNDDGKVWYRDCGAFGDAKPMTTAEVKDLNFNVKKSDFNEPKELGYVAISFHVCYEDNCDFDSATIQSSVSLRDYSYINDGH